MTEQQKTTRNGLKLVHSTSEEEQKRLDNQPKSAFAREMAKFADQLDAQIYSVLSQ